MLVRGNVQSWYAIPGFCVQWICYNYVEYNLEYVAVPVQDRTCMGLRGAGVSEQYKIWASPRSCIHIFCGFSGVSQGGLCVEDGSCVALVCTVFWLNCIVFRCR